jgi:tetratricopeptide (TPR) repeat protein
MYNILWQLTWIGVVLFLYSEIRAGERWARIPLLIFAFPFGLILLSSRANELFDHKAATSPPGSPKNQSLSRASAMQCLRRFSLDYPGFLKDKLLEKRPFFPLVALLLGVSTLITRIELHNVASLEPMFDSWSSYWYFVLLGSVLVGAGSYWTSGMLYHLRVLLSGGRESFKASRLLSLYAGIPIYLFTILAAVTYSAINGDSYFIAPTNDLLDYAILAFGVTAIVYSMILAYRGARLLHQTKLIPSIFLFILLPIFFYATSVGLLLLGTADPNDVASDNNDRALELMISGNYDEAEEFFHAALGEIEDREDLITVNSSLALLYKYKGETLKAVKAYEKVLSLLDTKEAKYYSVAARIEILKGNIPTAIEDLERSIRLDPDLVDSHNALGLIFLGEEGEEWLDHERALLHNEKAYSLQPEQPGTVRNLASNYYALGRHSDALRLFEIADEKWSDDADTKYFIGQIHYETGNLVLAKDFLSEAIALDPSLNDSTIEQILSK